MKKNGSGRSTASIWTERIVAIGVCLVSWIALYYTYLQDTPLIQGRFIGVWRGDTSFVQVGKEKPISLFCPYLYLVNKRKAAIDLLNFDLEVDFGKGFEKLQRLYGMDKTKTINFLNKGTKYEISIGKAWLTQKGTLAQFGSPVHGFVPFVGPPDKGEKNYAMRITVTDALGGRHIIEQNSRDCPGIALIQQLGGFDIPEGALEDYHPMTPK